MKKKFLLNFFSKSFFLLLVSLIATPVQGVGYVIEKGDSLSQIARKNGVSLTSLIEVNPFIKNPNLIRVGEALEIPEKEGVLGFGVATGYQKVLRTPITSSQTTIPVTSLLLRDGTAISLEALGTSRIFLSLNAGKNTEELAVCTGVSSSTLSFTSCTRGLPFSGSDLTGSSTLRRAHNAGSTVTLSNVHYIYEELTDRDSSENIGGIKTFTSSTLRIGDNTTTSNKIIEAYNGDVALPFVRYNETLNRWQFSDDGVNTTNFTTSSAGGLSASSTRGIEVIDSLIAVKASSTTGLSFDGAGNLLHSVSSTVGLQYTNGILEINSTTLRTHIGATTTPTAGGIPIASASGTISDGWIGIESNEKIFVTSSAQLASSTTEVVLASTTVQGGFLSTNNAISIDVPVTEFGITAGRALTISVYYGTSLFSLVLNNPSASNFERMAGGFKALILANNSTTSQKGILSFSFASSSAFGAALGGYLSFSTTSASTIAENSANALHLSVRASFSDSSTAINRFRTEGLVMTLIR